MDDHYHDRRQEWRQAITLWRSALRTGQLSLGRWLTLVQLQCEASAGLQPWQRRLPRLLRQLFPGEPLHTACMETARVLLQHQRPALAAAALSPLGERWRDTPCLALLQGEVLRRCGQVAQADACLQVALQDPLLRSQAASQLGELARSNGCFDQAAHWFLQAMGDDNRRASGTQYVQRILHHALGI